MEPTLEPMLHTPVHYIFESNLAMFINSMSCTIFLMNTYYSIKLLIRNRKPIFILNLIQSLFGLIVNLTILGFFFTFDLACPFRVHFAALGNLISTTAIELILLIKAKLVHDALPKPLYPIGQALMLLKLIAYIVNMVFTTITVTPLRNCSAMMNQIYGGLALGLDLIINLYLTALFLTIIFKQYRFNRLPIYQVFIQDGILYCLGIVGASILFSILGFSEVLGMNSSVLFNINWCISSLLTISQLKKHQKIHKRRIDKEANKMKGDKAGIFSSNSEGEATLNNSNQQDFEEWIEGRYNITSSKSNLELNVLKIEQFGSSL